MRRLLRIVPGTRPGDASSRADCRLQIIAMLRLASIAAATHTGQIRAHNEDAYWNEPALNGFLVADGLGGHAAGEVASRVAVQAAAEAWRVGRRCSSADAVLAAHHAVQAAARDGRGAPGMGCTLVAARVLDGLLTCAWLGDSRAYLWRDSRLAQISHDHSYVQSLLDAGVISTLEAAHHPERHALLRYAGAGALSGDDIGSVGVPAQPGDRVLLCSDGLNGELSAEAIAAELVRHERDQAAVDALVDAALAAGGHDNVTVALATLGEASPRSAF